MTKSSIRAKIFGGIQKLLGVIVNHYPISDDVTLAEPGRPLPIREPTPSSWESAPHWRRSAER